MYKHGFVMLFLVFRSHETLAGVLPDIDITMPLYRYILNKSNSVNQSMYTYSSQDFYVSIKTLSRKKSIRYANSYY